MRVKGLSVSKAADLSIYLEHTMWLSNVVLVEIIWKPPDHIFFISWDGFTNIAGLHGMFLPIVP